MQPKQKRRFWRLFIVTWKEFSWKLKGLNFLLLEIGRGVRSSPEVWDWFSYKFYKNYRLFNCFATKWSIISGWWFPMSRLRYREKADLKPNEGGIFKLNDCGYWGLLNLINFLSLLKTSDCYMVSNTALRVTLRNLVDLVRMHGIAWSSWKVEFFVELHRDISL